MKKQKRAIYRAIAKSQDEWVDVTKIVKKINDRELTREIIKFLIKDQLIAAHPRSRWSSMTSYERGRGPVYKLEELYLRFRLRDKEPEKKTNNIFWKIIVPFALSIISWFISRML